VQVDHRAMISLCSNDYLGLANAPEVIAAATQALTARSFDVAGVRFVSGAQGLLGVAQRSVVRHFSAGLEAPV
jgi:glycine C-acetyltransferase